MVSQINKRLRTIARRGQRLFDEHGNLTFQAKIGVLIVRRRRRGDNGKINLVTSQEFIDLGFTECAILVQISQVKYFQKLDAGLFKEYAMAIAHRAVAKQDRIISFVHIPTAPETVHSSAFVRFKHFCSYILLSEISIASIRLCDEDFTS